MKKYIYLIGFGSLFSFSAIAQNDIDAMRYSLLTFGGTARFASMAGSMGALGGDISTLSFNPAGIAIFKKTEISITPSFFSQTTSSTYSGTNSSDNKLNFNFGNIGLVATFILDPAKNNGWESANFGFGYNRTNNFHNRMSIVGDNKTSSLLDSYVAAANGNPSSSFDQFSTGLAWQTWLINPVDTSGSFNYNHVITNYGERQKKSSVTKGSMGETVLSFGGNYKNRVFIGATLGIIKERYVDETIYEETDEKDTINNFKSFKYTQNLTTTGSGINFKLGVIVKVTDWLRLGGAFHTPTALSLKDAYNNKMSSDLDHGVHYDTISPLGSYDYRLTTPFRAIGSIGFIINKVALINVDYEYVDYSFAELHADAGVFNEVNQTIHSKYAPANNIRIGGEYRLDPFAFRAGYALYGSPFNGGENANANRSSYTAGVGYRKSNYFIDFAYVLTKYKEFNYLYDSPKVTAVENNFKNSSYMVTFGLRF